MRKSALGLTALIAGVCALPVAASANSYICAIGKVFECEAVTGCQKPPPPPSTLADFIVHVIPQEDADRGCVDKPATPEDVEGMVVTDKKSSCMATRTKRPGTRRSRSRTER